MNTAIDNSPKKVYQAPEIASLDSNLSEGKATVNVTEISSIVGS
jgi:hypothetical protein